MSEIKGQNLQYLEYVLGFTAFTAGAVDVISYTKLGGIFASAMTGNLAFLGLYLARGSMKAAIGSFLALVGFVAGGVIGTLLTRAKARDESLTVLLAMEALLAAAFLLLWFLVPHGTGAPGTDLMIALLSVAMGMQSIVGKKVNLSNIPTVVFTSTLTNIVIGVTETLVSGQWRLPKDTGRQLASFFAYFFGALLTGVLVYLGWSLALAVPLLVLGAAFGVVLFDLRRRPATPSVMA